MNELSARNILEAYFIEVLDLPENAREWLLGLWDATQFLDDVADKDDVSRDQLNNAVNQLLIQMPANSFFMQHPSQLLASVAVFIAKWQASDHLERSGRADEKSYMWRAGYYDVILVVTILCHGLKTGSDVAADILSLYGESYESYKEEFGNG